jgi:hypothetical protein
MEIDHHSLSCGMCDSFENFGLLMYTFDKAYVVDEKNQLILNDFGDAW